MLQENEVKILFVTASVSMARELLTALQKDKKTSEQKAKFKITPVSDGLRMMDQISKHDFDLIIVEEDFVTSPATQWIKKINRISEMKEVPTEAPPIAISLNFEKTPNELKALVGVGFAEIFVRPFDMAIIVQKIDQVLPDKSVLDSPGLYRMETNEPVSVAVSQIIETISEVEVIILSSTQATTGDVVSLYGKPFSEKGENREVVGVCTKCIESRNKSYPFRVTYRLQGITPSLSKNIRNWIKTASVQNAANRIA
jgi:DNA-binding NarL/FixJ family response regulator